MRVEEFEALKNRVDELSSQHDQARGRYQAALDALKKMGFTNVKEAETSLKKKKQEEEKLIQEYEKAKEAFQEQWEEYL